MNTNTQTALYFYLVYINHYKFLQIPFKLMNYEFQLRWSMSHMSWFKDIISCQTIVLGSKHCIKCLLNLSFFLTLQNETFVICWIIDFKSWNRSKSNSVTQSKYLLTLPSVWSQSCEPCVTVEPLDTSDNDPDLVGSYKWVF